MRKSKRNVHERQHFSVDISSLLLLVDRSGNGILGGMLSGIFDSVGEGHVGWDMRGEETTDKHIICHSQKRNDVTLGGTPPCIPQSDVIGSGSNSRTRMSREHNTEWRDSSIFTKECKKRALSAEHKPSAAHVT